MQLYLHTLNRSGYQDCTWSAAYVPEAPVGLSVTISYTPGSAWSWVPVADSTAVDVSGAREAFAVCHEYACDLYALVGETVVLTSAQVGTRDALADATAALAAFIPVMPVVAS